MFKINICRLNCQLNKNISPFFSGASEAMSPRPRVVVAPLATNYFTQPPRRHLNAGTTRAPGLRETGKDVRERSDEGLVSPRVAPGRHTEDVLAQRLLSHILVGRT